MEVEALSLYFMDCYSILVLYSILEYLSVKISKKQVVYNDPYFFLMFIYLDYLGKRFRNDRLGFIRMFF